MTENPTPVDGVQEAPAEQGATDTQPKQQPKTKTPQQKAVGRWKATIGFFIAVVYVVYIGWSVVLLTLLPDPAGGRKDLVVAGLISAAVFGLIFAAIGAIGFLRASSPNAPSRSKTLALIILLIITAPGLLMSFGLPFFITREPTLSLDIINPTNPEDFVAPLAVTFSVERAVSTLENRGSRAVKYEWDIDGDGEKDEESLKPEITINFERDGIYRVAARIVLADGSIRRASRSMIINESVFKIRPIIPIVEQPTVFDISNVLTDPAQLKEVQWDFNNDGTIDETSTIPEAAFTYFTLGRKIIKATVFLQNNTQATYERSVEVSSPPPLAFPANLTTEPELLISPPPFGVRFSVNTNEPIGQILWDFGDGSPEEEGAQVTHTYQRRGNFPVSATIRSRSGSLVKLTTIVRLVEKLNISDLSFDGSPQFLGERINGEVPLSINITPRTSIPFVQFSWEAPDATEVGSTEESLQAIYRRPGTYNVTLIAQDAEDHVLRKTFEIEVVPRTHDVQFGMRPESGIAPLTVVVDASASFVPDQEITGYEWSFGDRTPRRTGSARLEHTFERPGTYTVELTVRTVNGDNYSTNKTIVVRPSPLEACIQTSRDTLSAGGGVRFDANCSTGTYEAVLWDFGDESQTDELAPVHIFEETGTFTVTLTLIDSSGREALTTTTITVTE